MNIFNTFRERIAARIEALAAEGRVPAGLDTARIVTEPPREASHGDMSCNAAMVLARDAGMKPRDLAELIVAGFTEDSDVVSTEIAGPGFINFRLKNNLYHSVVKNVLSAGKITPRWVIVENPDAEVRWASKLLECGYRLVWFFQDDEYFERRSR